MPCLTIDLGIGPSRRRSGGGGGGFDYTAANDTELNAILALGNTTLSGKSVGLLRGATFTTKTFSTNTALPLRFGAYGTGNKPRIDNLIMSGAQNIVMEDIDFVTSSWSATPLPCVSWAGAYGNITMRRCDRIGNYRGVLDVIDPLATYPEYACIIPVFNDSGVVTSFNITRPTVGDLMANGTYNMLFNSGSGINWTVFPVATFTVVSGTITGTTLTSGGSSDATSATNASIGALSARITWAGQRRMGEWLAFGDKAGTSPAQSGPIVLENCDWRCLSNGFKMGIPSGQAVTFNGWTADRCYQDSLSFGLGQGSTPPEVTVAWGFCQRPFALQGDAGDPHGDGNQFFYSSGKTTIAHNPRIRIWGNVIVLGATRGSYSNLFFLSDMETANRGYYAEVTGNIGMGGGGLSGINVDNAIDTVIWGNSIGRDVPSGGNTTTPSLRLGPTSASGNNLCGNNIAEGMGNGNGPGTVETTRWPNVLLGYRGGLIPYDTVFNTPETTDRNTLGKVLTAYQAEAAYTGKGHTLAGYVDFINRTIDRTKEPTFVAFPPKVDQPVSSVTESDWRRIIGGPDAVSVSCAAGTEYRTADDAAGTVGLSAWASSGTTAKGKYLQLRVTTAATNVTSTTGIVTLNGYSHTFAATTLSTATYPMVQFSGDDRWQRVIGGLSAADSYTGGFYLPRFKMAQPGTTTSIFGTTSGSAQLLIQVLSTGIMRITLRNTTSGAFAIINTAVSVADVTATEHDIKVSWDTSQATSALGVSVYVDGAVSVGSVTWAATPTLVSWSSGPSGGGSFSFGGTGAVFATFQTAGIWIHTADRPDLTSAVVRAKFYPDTIGSQGENPTGTAPAYWLNGNAAKWNGTSGLNDGANTNKFGGGSMTTPASTGGVGTVTDV